MCSRVGQQLNPQFCMQANACEGPGCIKHAGACRGPWVHQGVALIRDRLTRCILHVIFYMPNSISRPPPQGSPILGLGKRVWKGVACNLRHWQKEDGYLQMRFESLKCQMGNGFVSFTAGECHYTNIHNFLSGRRFICFQTQMYLHPSLPLRGWHTRQLCCGIGDRCHSP